MNKVNEASPASETSDVERVVICRLGDMSNNEILTDILESVKYLSERQKKEFESKPVRGFGGAGNLHQNAKTILRMVADRIGI